MTPKKAKTPHAIYRLANGTKVAGVTTYLSVLAKPALYRWNNKMGLQGIDTTVYVDNLADIGTLGHAMIMSHLTGKELDSSEYTPEQIDLAENCFLSYLNWEKPHKVEPILVETPLVSEQYRYGGTLDLLAKVDAIDTLIDFKTGKAIYPEHYIQVAAYWMLALEHGYSVHDGWILNIPRAETEFFDAKPVENLEANWEMFTHCLAIYELQKILRRKKK